MHRIMPWMIASFVFLVPTLLRAVEPATDSQPTPQKLRFFETHIRPIFVEHCLKCHGEEKQWAGLRLDRREALVLGGESGAAVMPGKPFESLLILAIRHDDSVSPMPPKGKLSDREIANFVTWIEQGAHFPPASALNATKSPTDELWSFQPPAEHPLPKVANSQWVLTGLDAFILAELELAGLNPAPPADKSALIRRVTFDLTGLPPTPSETAAFVADQRPAAYAELVERLLNSPAYGEHWGRHWLDVARYADSNGLDENLAHGNAWKYRDYVVAAFNRDLPYDQFLTEQLAGDLLPSATTDQRYERLIATGFLSLGAKVLAEVDETKMQMDIVDEQIDTMGRAFLGVTLGCARCHDHKFDPISTADYYALAGIFKSTRSMENFTKVARWYENSLPTPESAAAVAAHAAQVAELKSSIETFIAKADAAVSSAMTAGETAPDNKEALYPQETKTELKRLKDQLKELEKSPPEIPAAMGVSEGETEDVPVHVRGSHLKLGEVVPRRVPTRMHGPEVPQFPQSSSGRLELARWLVDPSHPLTARVLVNRVWRWHFGRGLVASVDNFGRLGEQPTHPELLDWLARRFVEGGWSMKSLHRDIVLSNTYQQSTRAEVPTLQRDPENRLWGRFNVRRLTAEELRDALLAVSGQLDGTMGGPVLTVKNRGYLFDHTSKDLTTYDSPRRSIYLPVIRNNVFDMFQLLDFPDASVSSGDRSTTTVAPQALLMLNSEIVLSASTHFASRLSREVPEEGPARIARMIRLAYGRDPQPQEIEQHLANLRDIERAWGAADASNPLAAWSVLCQIVLAANEFAYVN